MNKGINDRYFKYLICLVIYFLLNLNIEYIYYLLTYLCNHNYYKIKEINPNEKVDGKIYFTCGFCGKNKVEEIPKLDENHYFIEELKASCENGNGKRYTSINDKNKIYEITDNIRLDHSLYGSKCSVCHKNIGEFNFRRISNFSCFGYPRLYRLSEYWNHSWLLGGDNGTILCHRSYDNGLTWSEPSRVSNFPNFFCSNVDFFELPDHNVICSYRAIGQASYSNPFIKYNRKIISSISKDGGKTWNNLAIIIDNFELAKRLGKKNKDVINAVIHEPSVGFFEPFVQYFNNKITVIYADDFTPMILLLTGSIKESRREQSIYSQTYDLKNQKWSFKRKIIMNGYIKKSPNIGDLNKKISRDGMPVTDVMKDGTYVMVFEGTYRNENYHYFTGGKLDQYHPFEILISYSKDGEKWSNPVEIYNGHNKGSKYSAPFICISESDQIIISFQTDENSIDSGFKGDLFSIMKIIISKPGISIDQINKESFFGMSNNNNSPIGGSSLWSGMLLIGNIIYTCSSGHPILYSELPIYDEPYKYNDILKNKYLILSGDAEFFGNKIISKGINNIIINKRLKLNLSNNITTTIMPNIIGNCGIIFGFDYYKDKINSYYIFMINKRGNLSLKKVNLTLEKNLYSENDYIMKNYNKENIYKINLKYDCLLKLITVYVNEVEIFQIYDDSFENSGIGFMSSDNGTIFTQFLLE